MGGCSGCHWGALGGNRLCLFGHCCPAMATKVNMPLKRAPMEGATCHWHNRTHDLWVRELIVADVEDGEQVGEVHGVDLGHRVPQMPGDGRRRGR